MQAVRSVSVYLVSPASTSDPWLMHLQSSRNPLELERSGVHGRDSQLIRNSSSASFWRRLKAVSTNGSVLRDFLQLITNTSVWCLVGNGEWIIGTIIGGYIGGLL